VYTAVALVVAVGVICDSTPSLNGGKPFRSFSTVSESPLTHVNYLSLIVSYVIYIIYLGILLLVAFSYAFILIRRMQSSISFEQEQMYERQIFGGGTTMNTSPGNMSPSPQQVRRIIENPPPPILVKKDLNTGLEMTGGINERRPPSIIRDSTMEGVSMSPVVSVEGRRGTSSLGLSAIDTFRLLPKGRNSIIKGTNGANMQMKTDKKNSTIITLTIYMNRVILELLAYTGITFCVSIK
jgi:hypothetical protein